MAGCTPQRNRRRKGACNVWLCARKGLITSELARASPPGCNLALPEHGCVRLAGYLADAQVALASALGRCCSLALPEHGCIAVTGCHVHVNAQAYDCIL
eukprot:scaffold312428_cov18-Tisochrysis_lutea.AAC.1